MPDFSNNTIDPSENLTLNNLPKGTLSGGSVMSATSNAFFAPSFRSPGYNQVGSSRFTTEILPTDVRSGK